MPVRAGLFQKTIQCPKTAEIWLKIGFFFNLLKNLVIKFFSIWSPIKIYIICYINEKSSYLTTEFHKSRFKNLGPET